VDSKATLRAVVESDLDLLVLAGWFAGQRLTDGGPGEGHHLQAACPDGATQVRGRVLRTSREARDLLANPGIQIVKSAGMTCVADPVPGPLPDTHRPGRQALHPALATVAPVPQHRPVR
jgi:hypothetical protein